MDFSTELYLAAGLGALGLGGAALARGPRRASSRLFAGLCGALAVWCLGVFANRVRGEGGFPWHWVYLLGSCAAAPLGLHFVTRIAGTAGRVRSAYLRASYAVAGLLYLSSLTPLHRNRYAWNVSAILVLGAILLPALVVLWRHERSLGPGPERRAVRLFLGAGVLLALGGLSDFVPRLRGDPFRLGPAALLLFLLVVCAIVVRHRFLDVDAFLARALALALGATAASLFLYGVARASGERIFPLFLATLLVLAVAGPIGTLLLSGARALLGGEDGVAAALADVSRRLPLAKTPAEVWQAVERGRRALPGDVLFQAWTSDGPADPFRVVYRSGGGDGPGVVARGGPLEAVLEEERAPVTRRWLDAEAREGSAERRERARAALPVLRVMGAELAVPLLRGRTLAGWFTIGGGRPDRYVTGEVATALLAVGNQAIASLERIEALEEAKRRTALAAVGEMAAGLAHEVRNPVAAIRGAAQVLAVGPEEGRDGEMLQVIEEETERLGRVVGEFLEYARPASPRSEPVDLAALVERVVRAGEAAGEKMRVEVAVLSGKGVALGDPDQIQRAVVNIVRNAREAAGADGSLRVAISDQGPGRVAIRFEDDGPGIPDSEVGAVFQPFHTTKPGGTGLGLALVHRVAVAHGGEVRVEGRPGLGAAFTLVFPAPEAAA